MSRFFHKLYTSKHFPQAMAYLLFVVFAAGALLITMGIHANILQIGAVLKAGRSFYRLMYTAGAFFVFAPYVFAIVLLEAYLSGGAKKNLLWQRAKKVLIVEAGLGIFSLLVTWLTAALLLRVA